MNQPLDCFSHFTFLISYLVCHFQLKSSIQLYLDGSTAVVEDIGRQVLSGSIPAMKTIMFFWKGFTLLF